MRVLQDALGNRQPNAADEPSSSSDRPAGADRPAFLVVKRPPRKNSQSAMTRPATSEGMLDIKQSLDQPVSFSMAVSTRV